MNCLFIKKAQPMIELILGPISVLPVVARPFEKLMYKQLYIYFNENNLPFSGQSGYRSYHSVLTSLLHCTNDWYLNL